MGELQNPVELPSVALHPQDLMDLRSTLSTILHKERIEITILQEGKEQHYSSFGAIFNDELAPKTAQSFELRFQSEGGQGSITANSSEGDIHRLYLNGFHAWRVQVAERIGQFMDSRENPIRTIFSNRNVMAPISLLSSILAGNFFITISPIGIFYPSQRVLPLLYISYAITAAVFFSSAFRHQMFPYAHWNISNIGQNNSYMESVVKIIGLVVLTIITLPILSVILS